MSLLLDTHALVWWLLDDARLGSEARSLLRDELQTVHVSAASAFEIATKVRIGKMPGASGLVSIFDETLVEQGFRELPVTADHALRAGSLPGIHRDPFDRLLAAQAQAENLAIVSNDAIFDRYGVVRRW